MRRRKKFVNIFSVRRARTKLLYSKQQKIRT